MKKISAASFTLAAIVAAAAFITAAPQTHAASASVIINEFVSHPSSGSDWVELYNASGSPVDLTGWTLEDLAGNTHATTTTIAAHGFLAWSVGNDLNNAGDGIYLLDGSHATSSAVAYGSAATTTVDYEYAPTPALGESAYRGPDGGSSWYTTSTPTPGAANTPTITVSSNSISDLQTAVSSAPSGSTVEVSGGYTGDLTISKPLTLKGDSGASLLGQITVDSDNVTITGMTVTNPEAGYGIIATDHSNLTISGNTIHQIGSDGVQYKSGSAQAIAVISSSANVSNIDIERNTITGIGNIDMTHAGSAGSSAKGVYLGNSDGSHVFSNVKVIGNNITDIYASTAAWIGSPNYGGGAGAYGILVNYGAKSTGVTNGLDIENNSIGTLEGLWAHGIGLEGTTPGATVSGNTITGLTDHKGGTDAVGINIEDNGTPFNDASLESANTLSSLTWQIADKSGTSTIAVNSAWASAANGDLVGIGGGVEHMIGVNATSTIANGVSAVANNGTITVAASSSPYTGDVTLAKPVTLTSADANNKAEIAGAITVASNNVTVSNLNVTNPNAGYGIIGTDVSNVTVTGNTMHDIGTALTSGSAQAIAFVSNAANVSNLDIEGNTVTNVGTTTLTGAGSAGSSAKGVYLGNSSGSDTFSNVTVSNNTMSDIYASTANWVSGSLGGEGAYGLLVNHTASSLTVSGNSISTLEGLWAHAIGLEGNTPNAVVSGNTISGLTDHKTPSDSVALRLESNPSASTITGSGNTYGGKPLMLGTSNVIVDTSAGAASGNTYPEQLLNNAYHYDGVNAFSTVQSGVNGVSSGGTVNVDAGSYAENVTVNNPVSLFGPNESVNPNSGTRGAEAVLTGQITDSAGNTNIRGLTITNPSYSGPTIEGLHIYNAGSVISNIDVENNIFSDIANAQAHGAYGVMVQGVVSGVTVSNNKLDGITSAGWAHAIEVTPTKNALAVPQNVTVDGNFFSNVSNAAGNDEYAFSNDWDESTNNYADASQVTFQKNDLTGVNVRNLDAAHLLDASHNYWGSASGPSSTQAATSSVTVQPWYTDSAMTTLRWPTTSSGGEASTTVSNSTTLSGSNGSTSVTATIPAGTVVTGGASWDGTIEPPTASTTVSIAGFDPANTVAITVGSNNTDLTFDQAVRLVFAGQKGKSIGWYNAAGAFSEITDTCSADSQAAGNALAAGGSCKIDVGNDLAVWTKHFSTFVTYSTPQAPVITPGGGSFSKSIDVTMDNTTGGTIRYTTSNQNGAIIAPVCNGTGNTYTNGQVLTFTASATLDAIRCNGSTGSSVSSATFTDTTPNSSGGGGGGGGGGGSPVLLGAANTGTPATTGTAGTTGATGGGEVLGAAAYNFAHNLTVGSTGEDVVQLQKLLAADGDDIPAVTSGGTAYGYFGSQTKAAVILYQKKHGIAPTSGYVGPLTRAELNKGQIATTVENAQGQVLGASAARLTSSQVAAIVNLLKAFGADASVIANVQKALGR